MLRLTSRILAFWRLPSMILAQGTAIARTNWHQKVSKPSLWLSSGQYFSSVKSGKVLSFSIRRRIVLGLSLQSNSTYINFSVIRITTFGETHC